MPTDPIYRSLAETRRNQAVWAGDVLLHRAKGLVPTLVARASGSVYSHAAAVVWLSDSWGEWSPWVVETREWAGSRVTSLESQVRRRPGRIDLYRLRAGEHTQQRVMAASRYLLAATGRDYGVVGVARAAVRRLPFWRWALTPDTDDAALESTPPFCSQLIDQAWRAAGVELCPNRASRVTEPGHLAQSALLEYQYTFGDAG